jgi:2-keto-3-deoxy-L-rhamnonate aldolase RhmA
MLESKRLPLGIQCCTGNPALIEVIGVTGFDWIMLDTEHSGNDPRAMEDLVRTSQLAGLAAYVRVPDPRVPADIGRALEAGAEGVFLPQVASMADIDMAASAAFFPPKGERGLCPSVRAAGYSVAGLVEYTEWSNREIAIVPMIENSDALAIIDDICAHPDVHMVVFGRGDLAFSLGEGSDLDGPRTNAAYRNLLASAKRHGVAVIGGPVLVPTAEGCRRALEDGVTVFSLGLDTMAFRAWCENTVSALADGIAQSAEWSRPPVPPSGFPTPAIAATTTIK